MEMNAEGEGHPEHSRRRRTAFLSGGVKQQQHWIVDKSGKTVNSSGQVERHPSWNEALLDLGIVASFSVLDDFLDDIVSKENQRDILGACLVYILCFYQLYTHWQVRLN
jgi:hypothetical protein